MAGSAGDTLTTLQNGVQAINNLTNKITTAFSSIPQATTPGGSSGQIQFNNSGSFGGLTIGGDATLNSTNGALTVASHAITYGKIQAESATTLLGNPTGVSTSPSEVTLGSGLSFSGTSLVNTVFFTVPNVQVFTSGSTATYTTPTSSAGGNPLYILIRMVAGGGGGGAFGTNNGSSGGTTSFSSLWTAIGGNGGTNTANSSGGVGGSGGANGTGTLIRRISGGNGLYGNNGDHGGGTAIGPPTFNLTITQAGANGAPNSGAGGAGGISGTDGGSGGGGGEYVEFIIPSTSISSNYTYTVGTGGSGGAAGTEAGGNGAAGRIEAIAYWQ